MENAILMASGLGTRMLPLTQNTPKPLLKVCGKPMIETIIDGLQKRGVDNIYVVVGYLGEQFEYLKNKYSNIEIIENPDYQTINNISSVYAARHIIKEADCFICEADLYVSNPDIFLAELNESCYYGTMVKGYSDDWVFELDKDNYICRVGKGGNDLFNMVGVSYFKKKDAICVADAVEKIYGTDGFENMFWDEVVDRNLDNLKLRVHPIEREYIMELDTVEELENANKMMK